MTGRRGLAMAMAAAAMLAGCSLLPGDRSPARPRDTGGRGIPGLSRPDAGRCLVALGDSGARFQPLADRYYAPGCQALGSVKLDRIAGDGRASFTVTNLGPVACPLAEKFTGWVRFGVDRAAQQMLGSPLSRVETMGSYSWRTIAGSDRMSAHARAEAIDIGAFVLADGRRITVKGGWNGGSAQERAFLRTVHASACKRFGTVLGPDYNAAHADHLHLETGGRSFCR